MWGLSVWWLVWDLLGHPALSRVSRRFPGKTGRSQQRSRILTQVSLLRSPSVVLGWERKGKNLMSFPFQIPIGRKNISYWSSLPGIAIVFSSVSFCDLSTLPGSYQVGCFPNTDRQKCGLHFILGLGPTYYSSSQRNCPSLSFFLVLIFGSGSGSSLEVPFVFMGLFDTARNVYCLSRWNLTRYWKKKNIFFK